VLLVKYNDFMRYIDGDYRPLYYLTQVMAERLHSTTRHADSVATMNVKDRLKNLLSEIYAEKTSSVNKADSVTFKMSRKEMSLRIGCSRELAGKFLKELKDEGLVEYAGMKITVFSGIAC
jgi:CRP/FNR family cyclic AMP-dependent transcriptional regulator